MKRYLLIESQGTWAGPNAARFIEDACVLAEAGNEVSLFLVQDGVFAVADGASELLKRLAESGGNVLVDDFSTAQRALPARSLPSHVKQVGMDTVVQELFADGCQVVWH
ncbi:DsrE family protein [Streptomyces sp. N2-109]|uniref:DsrE family protein n=1 Tax=Streptomyces gossypii TaxID=2883101 RepID=A0ABT2JP57_9ACTN|nr:DsrE family protein [Streptomyces gossypii]MCT2589606.1 DsrE family protein [Streptomyces gossypii]